MKSLEPTYKEMVRDALFENIDGFNNKFLSVVSYRLAQTVNTLREEIASGLLEPTYELDEAIRSGSKSFIFRSSSDAKEFSKGLMEAGLHKKSFLTRGKTVTINSIPDRDMEEMVISMAKDMKAKITEELNILLLMKENLSEKSKLPFVLLDESFIVLDSKDCEAIINLHDSLNAENQKKLRNNLMESETNFIRILEFAHTNSVDEDDDDLTETKGEG
jgi:hypothetical protein